MLALETDHGLKQKLAAIGLAPMCDWLAYGCQTLPIPASIILACAPMFTKYLKEVPEKKSDLEGTPYFDSQNIEDNLDSNQSIEYKAELEPCFRNTALFGNDCYAEHS